MAIDAASVIHRSCSRSSPVARRRRRIRFTTQVAVVTMAMTMPPYRSTFMASPAAYGFGTPAGCIEPGSNAPPTDVVTVFNEATHRTGNHRREGRPPSGNSTNSRGMIAVTSGIHTQFDTQAAATPPDSAPPR